MTSPWIMLGVFLIILTATLAVWFLWIHRPARSMTPAAARDAIKRGEIQAVVDVRTNAEWSAGHYFHAVHVPLQEVHTRLPEEIPGRDTTILFYCRTGHRAAAAAMAAQQLGYTSVWYLDRGTYKDLEPRVKTHAY